MKYFDPQHPDSNGVGTSVEPNASAHSGSTDKHPTCYSRLYIEFFADIYMEIINSITGAGIVLDGTDRSQLLKAIKKLGGATGDVKFSYQTSIDGWVLNYGSIGSATSGATQRANADTLNLYTLLWNNVADAQAPVTGGRGASAVADFNANKPLTLPDGRGRVLAGKDNGANVLVTAMTGNTLGKVGGADMHTLTEPQLPAVDLTHDHDVTAVQNSTPLASADGASDNEAGNQTTFSTATASIGFGGGQAHNNTQPTLIMNQFIKL